MKKPKKSLCWLLVTVFVLGCGFWYRHSWPLERISFSYPAMTYGQEVELAEGFSRELYEESLIDINTATAEELMELPRVGETIAAAIVAYRQEHGPFETAEELMEVKGIGEVTFAQIKERVVVSQQAQGGGK